MRLHCQVFLAVLVLGLSPQLAFAYVGPGAGLSAIGAVLAVIAGLFVAIFGFLWYPIKRVLRKRRNAQSSASDASGDANRDSK